MELRVINKGDVIKSYKGFDPDLKCRGFQYEVGKEYEIEDGATVALCAKGFHACTNPIDVFEYYLICGNSKLARFCEVEQSGDFDYFMDISGSIGTSKVASSKIKIIREIPFDEFIKLCVDWIGNTIHVKASNPVNISFDENHTNIESDINCQKIVLCGDSSMVLSSGVNQVIESYGYNSVISSSNWHCNIKTFGALSTIFATNEYARIFLSGYRSRVFSSASHAAIKSTSENSDIFSTGKCVTVDSMAFHDLVHSSGDFAIINTSGDLTRIQSSGKNARITTSGNQTEIDSAGENAMIVCTGCYSKVKAKKGSVISMGELTPSGTPSMKTVVVDGEVIKEDTWYTFHNGEIAENNEYVKR